MRYTATRDPDGALRVKGVPIFVECSRKVGDDVREFDADWIRAAVAKAQQDEAGGYHAPLHVRHHEKGREVKAAGFFQVTGAEPITFQGEERLAIMADLVITDPSVQADVLARRFPYRSVEIHRVAEPSIDSLALLDHEAPFLRLPMLTVAEVSGRVQGGTFDPITAPTVAASFRRGPAAALLFKMDDQDDKPKPTQDDERDDAPPSANGDKPNDEQHGEDGGDEQPTSPDAKAIVKAIKSGAISVADLQAIVDAIHERGNASTGEPSGDDGNGDEPARAPAPGQSMQDEPDHTSTHMNATDTKNPAPDAVAMKALADAAEVKMAALQGKLDALEAKDRARDAADKRAKDVAEGIKRIGNRPAGSDLETKLGALHDKSPEAMFAYVEAIEKALPLAGTSTANGSPSFAGIGQKVPDVAMKYLDKGGADSVDAAAKFCAEWERQRGLGLSQTQEQYVELHMRRRAARMAEVATNKAG